MDIRLLADAPGVIPDLAAAFRREWGTYPGGGSVEEIAARFHDCLRRDRLPVALVALEGGALLGTVGLRWDSISTRPELGPWLAAFYVVPSRRGQGIGAELVRAAEDTARELGLGVLHAGTGTARSLFGRLGWTPVEELTYHGEPLTIFRRELGGLAAGARRHDPATRRSSDAVDP